MEFAARRPAPIARITVALARNDISSGEYSFARGALGFFAGLNVSSLVCAQIPA